MTGESNWSARAAWASGYVACAAGFLLCVVSFYPGYLSPDSIRQFTEARAWAFTDAHPPLMAAVWGVVDRVLPGPAGMLLLHNAAFWGALALFWRAVARRSLLAGLCLVASGFLPPVLALLSTIWKDVGMGASLLLASALIYTALRDGSKRALLASIPFLFYGYGVRHNAAPAVLPLALWSGVVACRLWPSLKERAAGRLRLLPFALGLAYFLALTAAVLLTTRALTGGRSGYFSQVVLLHDLTAISIERGEPLFPDYVLRGENFSLARAAATYQPDQAVDLFKSEGAVMKMTENPEEVAALRAKWLEVVPANKAAYLRHRWAAFRMMIGLGEAEVCFPYLVTSRPFAGYEVNLDWRVHRLLRAVFWKLRNTFFFRGYVWLLLSLGLLSTAAAGRLRGDLEPAFVLSLSGTLYGLAYFFFAPSCDFRYLWWTVLASLASLCLCVVPLVERWRVGVKRSTPLPRRA